MKFITAGKEQLSAQKVGQNKAEILLWNCTNQTWDYC